MDINTKTLRHQAAVITPLNLNNSRQPVDASVKDPVYATQKAEAQSVPAGIAVVDDAKVAKDRMS